MIELRDITRTYVLASRSRRGRGARVDVLRGIDLRIEAGEHVAIMGPSGSGKSTLMNIVGCLDRPTEGRYWLDERDVSTLDDDTISTIRGQTIGFVFQSFHLLANLTIEENVALPAEYQGVGRRERRTRATALLDRVGLGHRLGHRPNELSGGERQRVAIARALINRPRLVLADEPTGNLDSQVRDEILGLFATLREEMEITLIMVTHDPSIGEVAQRCVHMLDGRVVSDAQRARGS